MKQYCGKSDIPFTPRISSNTGGRNNLVIPKVPPSTSSCVISVQYSVVLHVGTVFGSRLEVELPVNIGKMMNSEGIMGLPPHTDADLHYSQPTSQYMVLLFKLMVIFDIPNLCLDSKHIETE